jgi:hypothetical protein
MPYPFILTLLLVDAFFILLFDPTNSLFRKNRQSPLVQPTIIYNKINNYIRGGPYILVVTVPDTITGFVQSKCVLVPV